MKLHEYQAKEIFRRYQLPVSEGYIAGSREGVMAACGKISAERWMVKVQSHAGGRGKAGGVKQVSTVQQAGDFADLWLGKNIVTNQTDAVGQPVHKILVESCTDIAQELYLGAVLDRAQRRVVVMASAEGGVDIEKVAAETPELIHTQALDPLVGAQPWQGRRLGFLLGLNTAQVGQFSKIFTALGRLFVERDLSLVEINPLVITAEGQVHCLDAKIDVDDNALWRQPELSEMRDFEQENAVEVRAAKAGLSYVSLDGNVGCMVNGAGLAMGTMDLIEHKGGKPANFLDVGGSSDADRVAEAFGIILSDVRVRSVLINIFGGIVRCDLIAEGILQAVQDVDVKVPVVVRLEGNRAAEGRALLETNQSALTVIAAASLEEAVETAVEKAQ